jgi:AcrR family transcriptional regulator
MAQGAMAPRTKRGERMREALLASARAVFERKGFHDARIVDITDGVPAALGTFYIYFPSKACIFKELADAMVEDLAAFALVREKDEPDPVARIQRSTANYIQVYRRHAAFISVFEQVAAFNAEFRALRRKARQLFIARFTRGIERLQAAGAADRSLDPAIAAAALAAMTDNFAYHWLGLGEPYDEVNAVATLSRLWVNALGMHVADGAGRNDRKSRGSVV